MISSEVGEENEFGGAQKLRDFSAACTGLSPQL
jgi:hypothetical protein